MKVSYNSPVILNCSLISVAVFIFCCFHSSFIPLLGLSSEFDFSSPRNYLNLLSYIFVHDTGSSQGINFAHLFANFSIILLIGPILEEKYGSRKLAIMIFLTAIFTAVLHILLFRGLLLIGASGIAFMMIILVSCTNFKKGEWPLTFILVLLIYLSNEVFNALRQDNISQFAHILGSVCGAGFGLKKGI